MTLHKSVLFIVVALVLALAGYFAYFGMSAKSALSETPDAPPQTVVLSGTYECLPHRDTSGPTTMECAFGFKTDDGVHYAVNFGASASAMEQFNNKAHITAEGFVIAKADLEPASQWDKYDMAGMFTVISVQNPPAQPSGASAKLNIDAVCKSALAYTTFTDGASADAFVQDCKNGKHPEVIERYKADMNLGDGAAI